MATDDEMRAIAEYMIAHNWTISKAVLYMCASNPVFIGKNGKPADFLIKAAKDLEDFMKKEGYYDNNRCRTF